MDFQKWFDTSYNYVHYVLQETVTQAKLWLFGAAKIQYALILDKCQLQKNVAADL